VKKGGAKRGTMQGGQVGKKTSTVDGGKQIKEEELLGRFEAHSEGNLKGFDHGKERRLIQEEGRQKKGVKRDWRRKRERRHSEGGHNWFMRRDWEEITKAPGSNK